MKKWLSTTAAVLATSTIVVAQNFANVEAGTERPVLSVDKSHTPSGPVEPGALITYTLVTTNSAPAEPGGATVGAALSIRMRDVLPVGVTCANVVTPLRDNGLCFDGVTTGVTPNPVRSVVDFLIFRVNPASANTTTYQVRMPAGAAPGAQYTNTAGVRYYEQQRADGTLFVWYPSTANIVDPAKTPNDTNPALDSDTVVIRSTTRSADLSLDKAVSAGPYAIGQTLDYTLTVVNDGPDASTASVVADVLPAGLSFVSVVSASQGSFDSSALTWSVGGLADGGSASLVLRARIESAGTFVNQAEIVSAGEPDPDSTPGNDSTTEDDDDSVSINVIGTSLGDRVWLDADRDGVQDAGEAGIANVDVVLVDAGPDGVCGNGDDPAPRTTTTDANGNYLFDGLRTDRTYCVSVDTATLPADVVQTFDLDGLGTANTATTAVPASGRTDVDFGYVLLGSIGDTVWFDIDGSGTATQDAGEPGLAGVDVIVTWLGPDGAPGGGDDVATRTTTGADGTYLVDDLPMGNYLVTIDPATLPDGVRATYDLDGASSANVSIANLTPAAPDRRDVDFSYAATASLGDRIWLDADRDGVQDDGEAGIGGLTVTAVWFGPDGVAGGGDDRTYTATTDDNGNYLFADLPPGNYSVTVTPPFGLTQTFDLDGVATANTATATLAAGQARRDVDFGYAGTASIGDQVWFDLDGDGSATLEAGDLPLAGVGIIVTFLGPDGAAGGGDDVEFRDVTDADGFYLVEGLPLGNYVVAVDPATLPAGLAPTFDLDGVGTANVASAELTATNRDRRDIDFSYTGTASIGDQVWFDALANGDGTFDSGPDLPLAGVTVTVTWLGPDGATGGGDDVEYTAVTDDDGLYLVEGLPFGDYTVSVDAATLPAGVEPTYDLDGITSANTSAAEVTVDNPDRRDVDFSYTGSGSIGDRVWLDADGDGVQDDGEAGIPGVTVTLTYTDADGNTVTRTATTGTDGTYLFSGLLPGSYTVTVTAPPGFDQTYDLDGLATANTTTVTLAAGEDRRDVDFGYNGAGSIGDQVWLEPDADGDGTFDAGTDTPLPGVTVLVTFLGADGAPGGGDDVAVTEVTDDNGFYLVEGLLPGSYVVAVDPATLPPSVQPTYDLDDIDTANTAAAELTTAAPDRRDVDFSYTLIATASIGDRVWWDLDRDGVQDAGEPGIADAAVSVVWAGRDGTLGTADDLTFTTVTDTEGNYLVDNLPAGNYAVTVTPPAGSEQTFDLDGLATANTAATTLTDGQDRRDVDFGYVGLGSIGDQVWFDTLANGDGVFEAGEDLPLAGVSVTVTWYGNDGVRGNADDLVFTDVTDADGFYLVDNLPMGRYAVEVDAATLPAGSEQTFDLDGLGSANSATAVLTPTSPDRRDVDFSYTGAGSIGDVVWFDTDGDGTQDPGEPGIAGVDVTVTYSGPDGSPVSLTVTTGADGSYLVDNLPAGTYTVTVTPPAGLDPTYDLDGIATGNTTTVELGAGEDRTDVDFGYTGSGSIGDVVWFDTDADGTQDPGEPGIPGVTVTLTYTGPDGSTITLITTTGPDGSYLFDNLPAGTYTVTVTPPAGLDPTYDLDGIATGNTTTVELGEGEDRTDVDFGYTGVGSIGDQLWFELDTDGDGVFDAGSDRPLPGVTVNVLWLGPDGEVGGGDDVAYTDVTDAGGFYLVEDLLPGTYVVTVDETTLPVSLEFTYDLDGPDTPSQATAELTVDAPDRRDVDFSYTLNGNGSIGDLVWLDLDSDGVVDDGEPGLPAVPVTVVWAGIDGVFGNDDDLAINTVTDADGVYVVDRLPAGNYTVTVTPPAGTEQTYDLDGLTSANTASTTLVDAQDRRDVDFGYVGLGSIGDQVWFDSLANGDGTFDSGPDVALAGVSVTVTALGADGVLGGGDDLVFADVTDEDGLYLVENLPAGSYLVTVDPATLPAGLAQTFDLDGLTTADAATAALTVAEPDRRDVDFSYTGAGSIGDRVWFDTDGDGVQDDGEEGIGGVTVTVTWAGPDGEPGTDDDVVYTAATDDEGDYVVNNLPAGTYTVAVTPPAGLEPTYDLDGIATGNTATVELGAGDDRTDVDFGYIGIGSIGDQVWIELDADGDGTFDEGSDLPVPGATVTVTGSGITVTTTTDEEGFYLVEGLPVGEYTVTVTPPAGYAPTYDLDGLTSANTATAELTAAAPDRRDVDFSYTGSGSIGDRVWLDVDGDGVQDPGEPGVGGLTVTLTGTGPDGTPFTLTTTTDASGNYVFDNLPPGDYTITVTPPAGFDPTFDLDGLSSANSTTVTLAPGQDRTDVDFGYTGTGSIGDTVWIDTDGDGVQDDGEEGIPGATVTVTWAGPDGDPGTDDDIAYVTTTDENGVYLVDNLPPGSYTVAVTPPDGLRPTFDLDGTATPNTATVALEPGDDRTDVDFGYNAPASLGDRIWYDRDADGVQDAGEPGIPGITVTVVWYGPDGVAGGGDDVTYTDVTDANGNYLVVDLPPGTYSVTVTPPAGWRQTFDLDGLGSANRATTTLTSGQNRTDVDFGYTGTGSIGDRVWNDIDRDGVQDAGEAPIAGVTVQVVWAGPDGRLGTADDVTFTDVTDGNGLYSVGNLPPGTYEVSLDPDTVPVGFSPTFDLDGTDDRETVVTLAPGQNRTDVDFGESASADLAVTKTHPADIVRPGDRITYTITVSNLGPAAAANVQILDTLPAGLTFVSASGTGWTCGLSAGKVGCSLAGALAPGTEAAEITLVVTATEAAAPGVTNTVRVISTTPDPNTSNNAASDPTPVYRLDLGVTKSLIDPLRVGGTARYRIAVTNAGPSAALVGDVEVVDTLPAALTAVSVNGDGFDCAIVGQTIGCSNSTVLAVNEVRVIDLTVRVGSVRPGTPVVNNVTVRSESQADPGSSNNGASASGTVTRSGSSGQLPRTGSQTIRVLVSALVTCTVGGGFLLASRRRRTV